MSIETIKPVICQANSLQATLKNVKNGQTWVKIPPVGFISLRVTAVLGENTPSRFYKP